MTSRFEIPVIDLFAGPGGLGEGFSAFCHEGLSPFKIGLSVEKDLQAHQTLRLRSFYRQFTTDEVPEIYYDCLRNNHTSGQIASLISKSSRRVKTAWDNACAEAVQAELGSSEEIHLTLSKSIKRVLGRKNRPWVLIGGPPCQAYSLAGRSRNRGNQGYQIEKDTRSTLYLEYLRIIAEHRPTLFVMENVKGMLSAKLDGKSVFDRILNDLENPAGVFAQTGKNFRYRIFPVTESAGLFSDSPRPEDYIVRSELYGVPQQRHRVILLGVRDDVELNQIPWIRKSPTPTVLDVIDDLPELRSGISKRTTGGNGRGYKAEDKDWAHVIAELIRNTTPGERGDIDWVRAVPPELKRCIKTSVVTITSRDLNRGRGFIPQKTGPSDRNPLADWFYDPRLEGICNHETRGHMDMDLARYLFAASYGKTYGISPNLNDFPSDLRPDHKSADRKIFMDRFRVQLGHKPSTTITSHISKDGHYFIHPDPTQCRSLTVREAARLQTFPDNYYFCGPRTSQYVQVGNAVPPWLARQIAECVWKVLVDSGSV